MSLTQFIINTVVSAIFAVIIGLALEGEQNIGVFFLLILIVQNQISIGMEIKRDNNE